MTSSNDIKTEEGSTSSGEETSPIVNFGKPDKGDPMQWPHSKKHLIVINVSLLAAFGSMSCSLIAPAVPKVMAEFQSTNGVLGVLIVTIFLIGQSVGLLFISSLSELFGRVPVFQVTNVLFVVFAVATAVSHSLSQLIAFRFLLGLAGACPPSIGGGVIGDMFPPQERGRATSIYAYGLILGPLVGPVIGGYLSEACGWRWTCWLVVICSGAMCVLTILVLRETYRPILLDRRVKKMKRDTGNNNITAALPRSHITPATLMHSLVTPFRLLFTIPIIFVPSILVAVIYGLFYLVISTMATVFQEIYGFSEGSSGLAYLGFGVGLVFMTTTFAMLSDRAHKKSAEKHTTPPKPEARLFPISFGAPLAFIALIMYGWGVDKHVHWMLPVVGTAIYGIALVCFMLTTSTYLIEVYKQHAAGPVGANAVLRQLAGGLLPLCATHLYGNLGQGWGNTLLAFIALIFTPVPWLFYKHGDKLRERFPITL